MVDGLGIGDVGSIVLNDRKAMSESGIVMVIVPLDESGQNITGEIEVVSRGFVFMKHADELIRNIQTEVAGYVRRSKSKDYAALKKDIERKLSRYLYQQTQRDPLVLPVITKL